MPLKILVPVFPSERFYDAVVAAGDLLAREGGTLTFLFTTLRPPPLWEEREDVGFEAELDPDVATRDADGDGSVEAWQAQMRASLDDAYDLLRERGVGDEQVNVLFADDEAAPAQAIADEAAAGAYDLVVLSKGAVIELPEAAGSDAKDAAQAVRELAEDGVKLLVT